MDDFGSSAVQIVQSFQYLKDNVLGFWLCYPAVGLHELRQLRTFTKFNGDAESLGSHIDHIIEFGYILMLQLLVVLVLSQDIMCCA